MNLRKRRWLRGIGVFILILFAFLTWYKITYSMEFVKAYEIGSPELTKKVLIATQGSEYKNSLTKGIIDHLRPQQVYIKVIDVSGLDTVNADEWDALVIMHTWEVTPQKDAARFIKKAYNPNKMLVVSTSGDGGNKIEGVDAITGTSIITDVNSHVQLLCNRLYNILQ